MVTHTGGDLVANAGLGSWPRRRARMTPDSVALVQNGRSLTYAELAGRASRLAGALAEAGVRPRDVVAYLGANDIAAFETFFAAGLIGGVFAPLNIRLAGAEINYLMRDSGAKVLVLGPECDVLLRSAGPLPESLDRVLALSRPPALRVGRIISVFLRLPGPNRSGRWR